MMNEIERKFLVCNDEWKKSISNTWHITQGYLSLAATGSQEVRVRIKTPCHEQGDALPQALMTIKSAGDLVRQEEEFSIDVDTAQRLLTMSISAPIHKTRHQVPHANHVFEVDVYEGLLTGLVVAEVELTSADAHVDLPSWIGQEVTTNVQYKNASLSQSLSLPVSSVPLRRRT